jgi:prevent-host-death family protein
MANVKSVGIKDLKNKLSAYIREAESGTKILVTDRNRVVAEIGKPFTEELDTTIHPAMREWIELGQVEMPRRKPVKLTPTNISLSFDVVQKILDEARGQ